MEKEKAEKEREILSTVEKIQVKRSGNSDVLRVPASWRDSFPQLAVDPLIFEAHVERDLNGRIYLVFRKERKVEALQK